jgi:hypothetical protein
MVGITLGILNWQTSSRAPFALAMSVLVRS